MCEAVDPRTPPEDLSTRWYTHFCPGLVPFHTISSWGTYKHVGQRQIARDTKPGRASHELSAFVSAGHADEL